MGQGMEEDFGDQILKKKGIFMKDNIKTIKKVDKENILGKMVQFILEHLKMI
jgi:hypothetical protein